MHVVFVCVICILRKEECSILWFYLCVNYFLYVHVIISLSIEYLVNGCATSKSGDSKELSKKTKRSTYDSNQARTKPWPTRPPTSDNNSPITKRIRQMRHQNVSLTLATVADFEGSKEVGTRAVVS